MSVLQRYLADWVFARIVLGVSLSPGEQFLSAQKYLIALMPISMVWFLGS